MIVRARTVVTMHGPPIENGAVAVSGNRIVDVGRFDDIKTHNGGNTVDLGEQVLLPGLINAHELQGMGFGQIVLFTHDRGSDETLELLASEVIARL